ncbi:MAG: hypothetical protein H0V82_09700 [Candidatus Protochlamydia sp.]|nr:hypothetical protein [Candidatus Protochlamydia sp.]
MTSNLNNNIGNDNFNLTLQFTQKIEKWNQSDYAILGPISARIAGVVCTPFIALSEASIHAVLIIGKAMTGLFVSPYNCLAMAFFPEFSIRSNLEFSSSLIHLMLAIESVFTAAILPLVCLMNPSRANAWMESRSGNLVKPFQRDVQNNAIQSYGEQNSDEVRLQALTHQHEGYVNWLKQEHETRLKQYEEITQSFKEKNLTEMGDLETKKIDVNKSVEDLVIMYESKLQNLQQSYELKLEELKANASNIQDTKEKITSTESNKLGSEQKNNNKNQKNEEKIDEYIQNLTDENWDNLIRDEKNQSISELMQEAHERELDKLEKKHLNAQEKSKSEYKKKLQDVTNAYKNKKLEIKSLQKKVDARISELITTCTNLEQQLAPFIKEEETLALVRETENEIQNMTELRPQHQKVILYHLSKINFSA